MRFRQAALQQLEAPERLDEVVRLATVPAWLMTITLVAILIAAGLWSALGTVSTTIRADGILIQSAGVSTLDATGSGQVVKIWVQANERVSAGTPLYTLRTATGKPRTVSSPWSAYVVSVQISDGQLLEPGTPVAELEPLNQPGEVLEAVVFVPVSYAAVLRPGTPVKIASPQAPSSVFGTLHGTVSSVGAFPETVSSLQAFLGAGFNVLPLLKNGSVVRVDIPLAMNSGPAGGLAWSKQAPSFQLDSESPLYASFTVARQHPINWLLGRS